MLARIANMSLGRFMLLYASPAAIFAVVALLLYRGLSLDPREIPSVMIDRPVPHFDLPPIAGHDLGLATTDLKGQVVLINVFASWCVSCRVEHPLLLELKREGKLPVYGIAYKDNPKDSAAWLHQLGDPYSRTGADVSGRVGIDFGVYGVPESYLIGKDGRIAYKQIGPITPDDLKNKILPLAQKLQGEG